MGDKSPKNTSKSKSQKETKANAEQQKKQKAAEAKQVPGKVPPKASDKKK